MKRKLIITVLLIVGIAVTIFFMKRDADEQNLPGRNLDLYAVLDLFHSSSTLQEFENSLNSKDKKVNNLDLNGDGKVDYIRVVDNSSGSSHTIILRVPLNKTESQDVAVIETEKIGDKEAHVQIVGDEDLYGKDYIIEPSDAASTQASAGFLFTTDVVVNVWYWPCISFIYAPDYVVWVSPWYWDYYPTWWFAWEPISYDVYYPVVVVYHDHWNRVYEHRFPECDHMYSRNRMHSDFERMLVKTKDGKQNAGGLLKKDVNAGAAAGDKIKPDKTPAGDKAAAGKLKTDQNVNQSSAAKTKINDQGAANNKKSVSTGIDQSPSPGSTPKAVKDNSSGITKPKMSDPKAESVSPRTGSPKNTILSTSSRTATPKAATAKKGKK